MASLNKCLFIGRIAADIDCRYTQNGEQVANFPIAINERYKDKHTNELREKTEYVRVVAFRKLAEIIGQYCKKGDQIYIEGKLQTRKWSDKNGQDHYTTEIIADSVQLLDSRRDDQGGYQQQGYQQQRPPRQNGNPRNNPPAQDSFESDDIPF